MDLSDGGRSPRHGAVVRGQTQKFLTPAAKSFVAGTSPPGRLTRVVAASAPGKSTAGNRPQRWRQEGRLLRHQAQFPHTPSGVQGAQVTARQGRRDRNGRCKPGVFTHRTVATARNRASGFGGDWRVRQQLPVGVGPDDRMPPGSREPKGVPAPRESEQQKRHNRKMPHTMTGRKGSAAGAALLHFRQA